MRLQLIHEAESINRDTHQMFLLYSSTITSKDIFAAMGLLSLSMVYMKFCKVWNTQHNKTHSEWRRCKAAPYYRQSNVKCLRVVCVYVLTVLTLLFLCLALMFLISATMCVYNVCGERRINTTWERYDTLKHIFTLQNLFSFFNIL